MAFILVACDRFVGMHHRKNAGDMGDISCRSSASGLYLTMEICDCPAEEAEGMLVVQMT